MSKKFMHYAFCLSVIQLLLTVVGVCRPFFQKPFFMGPMLPVMAFRIEVYTLRAVSDFGSDSNDFCKAVDAKMRQAGRHDHWCSSASGSEDLQHVMQRWCAPGIHEVMPDACEGLSAAYMLGLCIVLFVVTNLLLQGVACFMTYHYVTEVPKKKYREVSFTLLAIGSVPLSLTLLLYGGLVLLRLEYAQPRGLMSLAFTPSRGTGISDGYVLLWFSQVIQWAVLILYANGATVAEDMFEEAKAQQQLEAEMAATAAFADNMFGRRGGSLSAREPVFVGTVPASHGFAGGGPHPGMGGPQDFGGMATPMTQFSPGQPTSAAPWGGCGGGVPLQAGPAVSPLGFGGAPNQQPMRQQQMRPAW